MALIAVLVTVGSGAVSGARAQGQIVGDCGSFDFYRLFGGERSRNDDGKAVITLRDNVEAFAEPDGRTVAAKVPFNTAMIVLEDGRDLVGVVRLGTKQRMWMRRSDLLCNAKPMIDRASGLERKALVKTQASAREEGKIATVTAARNADLSGCNNDCRQLSRFDMNYVYAEAPDAVLLSPEITVERGSIQTSAALVGWVRKSEVVEWPWAVGLRGSETLTYNDGPGTFCAYRSPADAEAKRDCQRILGGTEWFRSPLRLLVLNQANGFYEVVAPVAGSGADSINPSLLRNGQDITVVNRLNRLDVFFVIDGTKSMQPWIDAIRGTPGRPGVVQKIIESLQTKTSGGMTFRFGFRVFRDSNASGGTGLDDQEALRLGGGDCERMPEDEIRRNRTIFRDRIAAVTARDDAGDTDYSENVFGGLDQALRDIQGCPTNAKLIFVIGDAGYDAAMQSKRGQQPVEASRLAQRIAGLPSASLFFLRTARDPQNARQQYADAYEAFNAQAFEILSQIPAQSDRATDFIATLDGFSGTTETLLDRIVAATQGLANPQVVKEIELDLRGGASLLEAINRLRDVNKDVPGLFFKLLEKNVCTDLGEACTKRTFQTVTNLFIPVDEPALKLDVWMDQSQLESWLRLLNTVLDVDQAMDARRKGLVDSLALSLQSIIKDPPYDNSGESIGMYLRRAGRLPYSFRSPLLEYSFSEFIDTRVTPTCEIIRLFEWMRASKDALQIVRRGGSTIADIPFLPDSVKTQNLAECQGMSKHGQYIPIVDGLVKPKGLPGSGYSICSSMRSAFLCWVPQDYLP
jgi:hypothetical protein